MFDITINLAFTQIKNTEANLIVTILDAIDALTIFCASIRVMGLSSDFMKLEFIVWDFLLVVKSYV